MKHYAWAICAACTLVYLCDIGLCSNILSVYLPFIEASGVSDSMGSAILSVRSLFAFLTTFFLGFFYKKLSLRNGLLLFMLIGAFAAVIFSIGGSVFMYYIAASIAGIAYGGGCIYPTSILLSNWFESRRGFALGISSAGSGIAAMVFAPVISAVVQKYSVHTAFLIQAAFMALCAVTVFLIVRDTPEKKGLLPYGAGMSEKAKPKNAFSESKISRANLIMLCVATLFCGGVAIAFLGHLSVLAVSCGYGVNVGAQLVSTLGFMLVFSKMISGNIADRIGAKRSSMILMTVFAAGCLFVMGLNGENVWICYVMVAFLGFGASLFNIGPPLWAMAFSPKEEYASTLKWLQLCYNLGGILLPVIPGIIAEHTGEYRSAYLMFAVLMCVNFVILLTAYRNQKVNQKKQGM